MIRRAARLAVTTLLVVAAWVGLPASTAHAADGACPGRTGATVVVDFNELDGGVQGACVSDGGGDLASDLFRTAGFPINADTPRNPGYVCQVSSKPAGCTPPDSNRYWGLWWSNGKNGTWTYSSLGAGSLRVPDGGYVAFAWDQDPSGNELPSYEPAVRAAPSPSPSPSPTRPPSTSPTRTPSASATPSTSPTPSASATPSASPSSTPSATPTTSASPTPSATPTPTDPTTPTPGATPTDAVTDLAEPVAPTSADEGDAGDAARGLPAWVVLLVIVLLFAAAGVGLVLRRRQTDSP